MKRLLPLIAIFLIVFSSTGCKKEKNTGGANSQVTADILKQGKWVVTLYSVGNLVNTYKFTDYEFSFSTGSTVIAAKGTTSTTGSWNGYESNGYKLFLNFVSTPFDELNGEWSIIQQNANLVEMQGSDGSIEKLTIVRL